MEDSNNTVNKMTELNKSDNSDFLSKDFLNFLSVAYKLTVSSEKNMTNDEFNKLISCYSAAFDKPDIHDRSSAAVFSKFNSQGIDNILIGSTRLQCPNKKRVGDAISSLEKKYNMFMNKKSTANNVSNMGEKMRHNLNELLQEEILDSVLPYICPKISNAEINKIHLPESNLTKRLPVGSFNFMSNHRLQLFSD